MFGVICRLSTFTPHIPAIVWKLPSCKTLLQSTDWRLRSVFAAISVQSLIGVFAEIFS